MTFWRAQQRARQAGGKLVLRAEDSDSIGVRKEYADAISEDLRWFALDWDEGPDIGGPFVPYLQSARRRFCLEPLEKLRVGGYVVPANARART